VVDAGHNVVNVNTTIPLYFGRAVDGAWLSPKTSCWVDMAVDPQIELNYTYNEYSPGAKFPRNDAWSAPSLTSVDDSTITPIRYPRARALGGSTV
jgi:hypothetical protein